MITRKGELKVFHFEEMEPCLIKTVEDHVGRDALQGCSTANLTVRFGNRWSRSIGVQI